LSEKWEGLAMLRLNDPDATNDFLLLVGNDNDFKASTVYHNGVIVGTNAITVDSMMLAFRIGVETNAPLLSLTCPGPLTNAAVGGCSAIQHCEIASVTTSEGGVTLTGASSPDWQITGALSLKLRAKRSGTAIDRIYTIKILCTDATSIVVRAMTSVAVPHDQ